MYQLCATAQRKNTTLLLRHHETMNLTTNDAINDIVNATTMPVAQNFTTPNEN
jgi:hypothetical protein